MSKYLQNLKGQQNQVLTRLAFSYKFGGFVGFSLFPIIRHPVDSGKIAIFKKQNQVSNYKRALGALSKRIVDDVEGFKDFTINEESLERPVDDREWMNAIDPMKAKLLSEKGKLKVLQNELAMSIEYRQATLATDPANFDNKDALSGTSQFSHTDSDPIKKIEEIKQTVADEINCKPEELTLLISSPVWQVIKNHSKLLERIKYTDRGIITENIGKEIFEVKNLIIGRATHSHGETKESMWGNNIICCYVPETIESIEEPVFGATVRQEGYPIVLSYREERSSSTVTQYKDALEPVIVNSKAGFLLQNCIAE